MNQLRRKFANLWNPAHQEDEGPEQQHGPNGNNLSRRASSGSSSSLGVPAALELDAAGRDSPRRDGQDEKKADNDGADEHTSPPRLLSLSHPWGTSDPNPPPGWASSSSRPASQRRSHGKLLHVRHHSGSDRYENGTAVGDGRPSTHTDLGSPAAALGAAAGLRAAAGLGAVAGLGAAADGVGRRRRTREEEEECAYHTGTYLGNTKRHRAEEKGEQQEQLAANGGEEGLDRRRQASSRFLRRTCPADSTFVSPAKRSVSYCASAAGVPANAVAADEEELELEYRRSSTPSRLIFRSGFFKALLGTRAAAKRARSTTKLKRKTRELQAAIIRQAFHSAHPPHEGRSENGGEEERKEESVPRRMKGATGELSAWEEESLEMWRRVNVAEEEHGKAAEEKAMARMRRLKNLRAEALMAFGQAQEALADLVATANIAFDAAEGPDMAKLRSLFAGGADSPSSRFKDDEEVRSLQKKYSALEAFLKQVKEANDAGNSAGLEALLSSEAAKGVKNQPEVASASEALKAAKNKDAEDARAKAVAAAAAAAAAEAAKAQQEKDQAAAALAASRAQADATDQAKAAAEAKAVAAALKKAQDEEKDVAEAAQAAAAGALVAEKARFAEKASELKANVQGRRAAVDEILASSDPGVKKIRMAFKKSYQGCLNKLSATPSTVRQVARDIQIKAEAPLADARRAGWEAKAKEFLFFNLADKLVDYSERDHFSGDSYRMAFPLACVAVDLMEEHAGLSELFLGTLYLRCPSAVPALSFDTAGLSDGEVMALLGQTGGEDLPTFLNRTKGLVVLMAAVMQTPAHGGATTKHPLPLWQGWCWLARFVNGMAGYVKKGNPPPVPAGPVLEWFLKVAGFELQRHYGRAFDKVVQAIKTEILPILLPKSVVPHLLDVVMEDYEGRGRRFLPPAGRDKEFRHFRVWGDT